MSTKWDENHSSISSSTKKIRRILIVGCMARFTVHVFRKTKIEFLRSSRVEDVTDDALPLSNRQRLSNATITNNELCFVEHIYVPNTDAELTWQ